MLCDSINSFNLQNINLNIWIKFKRFGTMIRVSSYQNNFDSFSISQATFSDKKQKRKLYDF